jgi:hypothetical protein
MATRLQSILNFIFVFVILLFILAIMSPSQFNSLVRILSDSTNLILIVVLIALVALILRKAERI